MCFGGGSYSAPTPASAPPQASPLATATTPLYGQQAETANQSGYQDGQPKLLRDDSVATQGTQPGVGGLTVGASGLGQM